MVRRWRRIIGHKIGRKTLFATVSGDHFRRIG